MNPAILLEALGLRSAGRFEELFDSGGHPGRRQGLWCFPAHRGSRQLQCAMFAGLVTAGLCQAGAVTDAWLGGTGSWSASSGWSAGSPNNSGSTSYAVGVASGGTDQVILDTSFSIDSLGIGGLVGLTGSSSVNSGTGSFTAALGGDLAVGQTGALRLYNGDSWTVGGTASNSGFLLATSGASLDVRNLVNTVFGAVGVSGATGATLTVGETLSNGGYLHVDAGSIANVNTLANTGRLDITGTFNLTGGGAGVTSIATGADIQLGGAGSFNVINGGVATNALSNLTEIDGELVLGNQALSLGSLTNTGNLQVILPGAALSLTGDLTNYNGAISVGRGASDVTVAGDLNNTGLVGAGLGVEYGSTLTVDGVLRNSANSRVVINGTACVGGGVSTSGTILIGPDGTLNGSGCGTTSLTEVISSAGSFGSFGYSNAANLGGSLDVQIGNSFMPTVGESFNFISFAPGQLNGSFTGIQNDLFNNNTERWVLTYDNADGKVILTAEAAQAAPEPAGIFLMVVALAALGVWRHSEVARARA